MFRFKFFFVIFLVIFLFLFASAQIIAEQPMSSVMALEFLESLRSGNSSSLASVYIGIINAGVSSGDYTLEEIGTTWEELEQLKINDRKRDALEFLKCLREERASPASIYVNIILNKVKNGDYSLEELGTTREELEQLKIDCEKKDALKFLGYLREGKASPAKLYVNIILNGVTLNFYSLKELGTTAEELEKFIKK